MRATTVRSVTGAILSWGAGLHHVVRGVSRGGAGHCGGGVPREVSSRDTPPSWWSLSATEVSDSGQRTRSVSTMSTRTFCPPARAPTTVRSALAVRPRRPMTDTEAAEDTQTEGESDKAEA